MGMLAAYSYITFGGGFQLLTSLYALFIGKNKFTKFSAVQGLVYHIFFFVSMMIFFGGLTILISPYNTEDSIIRPFLMVIVLSVILVLFVIIPLYLANKALHEIPFYFPIIGKPIARLVGYNENEAKK